MVSISESNRKWWVLAAMSASLALVFIDQTAVSVTLPIIQREFNTSDTLLQWIINAYLLALASLVIFGGKVGDLLGHRSAFLSGVVVFLLASVACAISQSDWQLIASRALQGIGGAFMIPSTTTIVINTFPPEERGRAMGIYVGSASLFLAFGPTLGGVLTEYLNWRWVFWINLPLGILSVFLAHRVVSKADVKKQLLVDWLGFFSLTLCMFCIVFALMEAVNYGWTSPFILALFALGITAFITFIKREKKSSRPLIDLTIFKNSTFARASTVLLVMQSVFIVFVFWSLFLQNVLRYPPAKVGLLLLPITLPIIFMAPFAGYLRDKFGYRWPMVAGNVLTIISLLWVAIAASYQSYALILPAFILLGCASPLIMSCCMTAALSSVEAERRGVASGVTSAFRQLGGTLGLALTTSLIVALNRWQLTQALEGSDTSLNATQLDGLLSGSEVAQKAVAALSHADSQLVYTLTANAYTSAFSMTMYGVAFIALIGLVISLKMPHE